MWRRNRSYGVRTSARAILTMKKKPKKKWMDIFVVFISLMKIIICCFPEFLCMFFFPFLFSSFAGGLQDIWKDVTKRKRTLKIRLTYGQTTEALAETRQSGVLFKFDSASFPTRNPLNSNWCGHSTCRECSWPVRLTCRQELKVRNWEFEMNRVISHFSLSLSLSLSHARVSEKRRN